MPKHDDGGAEVEIKPEWEAARIEAACVKREDRCLMVCVTCERVSRQALAAVAPLILAEGRRAGLEEARRVCGEAMEAFSGQPERRLAARSCLRRVRALIDKEADDA